MKSVASEASEVAKRSAAAQAATTGRDGCTGSPFVPRPLRAPCLLPLPGRHRSESNVRALAEPLQEAARKHRKTAGIRARRAAVLRSRRPGVSWVLHLDAAP